MKLLHLSDWHLGRETYNTSRAEDHDAVIGEMLGYAREHKPDLIVHTGDLFERGPALLSRDGPRRQRAARTGRDSPGGRAVRQS